MRLISRSPLASLGSFAGLALALSACADPLSPSVSTGVEPMAAVGADNSQPVQETFGTGVSVSGNRDTRFDVCLGGACAPAEFFDAYVLTRNQRWAFPIGYPGNSVAPASIQTQWIGPTDDANQFLSEPRGDDVYQTTFTLPANAVDAALNVRLYADNQATVYVNGVQIGQQSAGGTHDGDHYPNYGCNYLMPANYCGAPDQAPFNGTEASYSAGAKALYNSLGNPNWVAPVAYTTTGDAVPFVYGGVNTLRIVVHNAEFKQGCAVRTDDPRCPSATGLDLLAELRYGLRGDEGCTPGYWKQSQHFDSWTAPYDPTDLITSLFPAAGTGTSTLLDALQGGGGSGVAGAKKILLRAAVAAVLNAASSNVDYTMSVGDIQTAVHVALTSNDRDKMLELAAKLDADNNLGCPLN